MNISSHKSKHELDKCDSVECKTHTLYWWSMTNTEVFLDIELNDVTAVGGMINHVAVMTRPSQLFLEMSNMIYKERILSGLKCSCDVSHVLHQVTWYAWIRNNFNFKFRNYFETKNGSKVRYKHFSIIVSGNVPLKDQPEDFFQFDCRLRMINVHCVVTLTQDQII